MIFGFLRKNLEIKAVAVAFITSWREGRNGADQQTARLAGFRDGLYCSLGMRRDALFEICDAQAAQLRKRIARNEASQKGLISELAQLGDDTSPAAEYRKRIREHHTELDSQAAALHAHLEAITAQAASENDPTLISELPYAPGSLLQAPDHVREALYAALNLHCTFRGDKQQVTIRATITDTTPGIVAALIADPRTDTGSSKRSPGPLDDPNNSAITTETPWIYYAMSERCEPGGEASSQERKPVSASSVMASSTLSESPVESSTTTRSAPRTLASAASEGRRDCTVSDLRCSTCSGRNLTSSAPYQHSSSPWYEATPRRQAPRPAGCRRPHSTVAPPRSSR